MKNLSSKLGEVEIGKEEIDTLLDACFVDKMMTSFKYCYTSVPILMFLINSRVDREDLIQRFWEAFFQDFSNFISSTQSLMRIINLLIRIELFCQK